MQTDFLNLSTLDFLFLFLIIFLGGLISSATGFGSGIVRMPLLLQFFLVRFASPLENLMGLVNNLFVLSIDKKARQSIKWKVLFGLIFGNLLGALIGSRLLATIENNWLVKVVGVFIILWEAKFIVEEFYFNQRQKSVIEKDEKVLDEDSEKAQTEKIETPKKFKNNFLIDSVVGIISGIGSSLFSIGGPPLVIYMQFFFKENKEVMRASLLGFFTVNGLIQIFTLSINGLITSQILFTVLICLPILFFSSFVGKKLNDIMNKTQYKIATSVVLIVAGLLLVFK